MLLMVWQIDCGILVFLTVLFGITLLNLFGMRRLGDRESGLAKPRVSVLVPARNEEQSIRECVSGLLAQTYENYEVIVLDDASQDRTLAMVQQIAERNTRLRVLCGSPLPSGWHGKNWACYQLAQAADGALLLLMDADTKQAPKLVANAVAELEAGHLDFLSGMPRQVVSTWSEKLTVPFMPWVVQTLFPIPVARMIGLPTFAVAVGQFMLFRRQAYDQIGGHASVRENVAEDFALARLIKAAGLRADFVDATRQIETRMYHNWREVQDGFSKNLFGVFHNRLMPFAFIWVWLVIVFVYPPIELAWNGLVTGFSSVTPILAGIAVVLSFALWGIAFWRFRIPVWLALFYPITVVLFAALAARSAGLYYRRRPVEWKGRPVPQTTPVRK